MITLELRNSKNTFRYKEIGLGVPLTYGDGTSILIKRADVDICITNGRISATSTRRDPDELVRLVDLEIISHDAGYNGLLGKTNL